VNWTELMAELRKHKGEFANVNMGVIRHKTELCEDGSLCCPLAFLVRKRGKKVPSNLSWELFDNTLSIERHVRLAIMYSADGQVAFNNNLRKELEEACL